MKERIVVFYIWKSHLFILVHAFTGNSSGPWQLSIVWFCQRPPHDIVWWNKLQQLFWGTVHTLPVSDLLHWSKHLTCTQTHTHTHTRTHTHTIWFHSSVSCVYIYTCVWCRCLWMCALVIIMGLNHLHNNCNPSDVLSFWRFRHFTAVAMVVLHATVLWLSSLVMTLFSLTVVDQTRARMFQWMCPSSPMVTSPQELTSIVSWKENDTRCVALLCFWQDGLLPMILSKILMVFSVSWWRCWSWFCSLEIQ